MGKSNKVQRQKTEVMKDNIRFEIMNKKQNVEDLVQNLYQESFDESDKQSYEEMMDAMN